MRKFVLIAVAVLHLLLPDAVTKELAIGYLKDAPPRVVIDGLLDFAYVENRGCAWGMLQGHVWPLVLFGVLALSFIVWKRVQLFYPDAPKGRRLALGALAEVMLYAGIVGNMVDRVFRGCVVDFIDFHWGSRWHFPCFNVADSYITVAAAVMILLSLTAPGDAPAKKRVA